MYAKYKLLIGVAIFSGLTGSAAAQNTTTANCNKASSHIVAPIIAPIVAPIVASGQKASLVIENTAQQVETARRSGPLSASPPFADKDTTTRLGSISPLTDQVDPNQSRQVGEMEPIIKVATNQVAEVSKADVMIPLPSDEWTQVLAKFTSLDPQNLVRFDYGALQASKADTALLADYIEGLSQRKPSAMPENEAMAYWANLYNALTVQVVAQNYPVKSIRNIKSGRRKGPWKRKLVNVEGKDLTLDNIEHDIMRPTYKTRLYIIWSIAPLLAVLTLRQVRGRRKR